MNRPFIKWAGGKTRLMPELLSHLPAGDLLIEPFVGSASVFLNTNYRRYILADINWHLINMYRVAKNETTDFIARSRYLFETCTEQSDYLKVRDLFNSLERSGVKTNYATQLEMAALFLYLNRHGYNGLCRYNQSGAYNNPYASSKSVRYFPLQEILFFAEKANDTKALIMCADFKNTLKIISGENPVIYCDPPYIPTSETANFTAYHSSPFADAEHRELVDVLINANRISGAQIVISNSDTETTREIYSAFNLHEVSVRRSISSNAASRAPAAEVIGVLKTCSGCGCHGGGICPDCGPVCGDATYNEMAASGVFTDVEIA